MTLNEFMNSLKPPQQISQRNMMINKLFDDNLDVEIHFGYAESSNINSNYFRLTLTDKKSSSQFLELKIPRDQIANFFSNRFATGTCMLSVIDVLNKNREFKEVFIPAKDTEKESYQTCVYDDKNLKRIFDEAEKQNPGWSAQREQRFNFHRLDDKYNYRVMLERWV